MSAGATTHGAIAELVHNSLCIIMITGHIIFKLTEEDDGEKKRNELGVSIYAGFLLVGKVCKAAD